MKKDSRERYINLKVVEHLEDFYKHFPNLESVYIGLQGSQNYNLDIYTDEYQSDIDTKVIVLPTLNDIVLNKKPVSTTFIRENGEHIDIKDIRLMFDCFKKQNINFIEILFTEYSIFNHEYEDLMDELIYKRELIARYNPYQAVKCMAGMSLEKKKALCHPYPTIKDKIEKYGYDGKQLHHIIRMENFIEGYVKGLSYEECLQYQPAKQLMLKAKLNEFNLEEALKIANAYDTYTHNIKDSYINNHELKVNQEAEELLNKIQYECIKRYFKKGLI